jgi:hypothetical protein
MRRSPGGAGVSPANLAEYDAGAHRDRSLLTPYYPGPGPDHKLG